MHDIGKLKIELTDSEAMLTMNEDEVKDHPVIGYKMIREEFELPKILPKLRLNIMKIMMVQGILKGCQAIIFQSTAKLLMWQIFMIILHSIEPILW